MSYRLRYIVENGEVKYPTDLEVSDLTHLRSLARKRGMKMEKIIDKYGTVGYHLYDDENYHEWWG